MGNSKCQIKLYIFHHVNLNLTLSLPYNLKLPSYSVKFCVHKKSNLNTHKNALSYSIPITHSFSPHEREREKTRT